MLKLILVSLLTASSAYSLGATQCSTAKGEFTQTEKEIWGANQIDYKLKLNGVDYQVLFVEPVVDTKVVLEENQIGDTVNTLYTTYSQKVRVVYQGDLSQLPPGMSVHPGRVELWVICSAYENDGID